MVDYFKVTGDNPNPDYKGSMMIRDLGTTVEFWIRAGSENTWRDNMPYGWTVNGSTGTSTKDYPTGRDWLFLRSFTVTTSQTVTFRLFETNTEGLGGPTTFSQYISRSAVPDPPTRPNISQIMPTSVYVTFSDGDSNGSTITDRYIGYGTNSTTVQTTVPSDRSTTITGLKPGTQYYFWARTKNARGLSSWSPRATAKTLPGARVRYAGAWKQAIPYVKVAGVWRMAVPYVRSGGSWKNTG